MLKKLLSILVISFSLIGLVACQQKESANSIRVGTIAGPETQLMEVAQTVALKRYGLHVKIISFSDYNTPNAALADGSIDANMFQHTPYLNAQIKIRNYPIEAIAKTFIYPMGLYSKKIKNLSELAIGDKLSIPSDPSNESRALILLQKAKLIRLKTGASIEATPRDIVDNPKKLRFVELDAAQLPRSLGDVSLSVINANYVIPSGLSPTHDALFVEGPDSPYANVIVARKDNKDDLRLKQLVSAFQSSEVLEAARKIFGDAAIPAWKN